MNFEKFKKYLWNASCKIEVLSFKDLDNDNFCLISEKVDNGKTTVLYTYKLPTTKLTISQKSIEIIIFI